MTGPDGGGNGFAVYPLPPHAPLQVAPAAFGELALTQLAGPAVGGLPYAQMMFVRVAASGGPAEPIFTMTAGRGDPVPLTQEPVPIYRDPRGDEFVGDVWIDGVEPHGVHRIFIGFEAHTIELWRFRMGNTDPRREYRFTCVVGNNPDETLQPWLDLSPAELEFDELAGVASEKSVEVANYGTTGFTLTGVGPLPPPLAVTTALPVAVPPAGVSRLEIAFAAPTEPPHPDGVLTASAPLSITPSDGDSGASPGHNGSLAIRARTRQPPPAFGPVGAQFTPSSGPTGTVITLSGENFDTSGVVVRFGDIEADAPTVVAASELEVAVPAGLLVTALRSREVEITIDSDTGSATSDDMFVVTAELPVLQRILYYSASRGRGCIGTVDGDNRLADLAVIAPGGFASDWTQITGLSGGRILYYSAGSGRGCIGTIDGDNRLADLAVIAPGGFASDWTQITGLSGDRILYYSASRGRGCIGTIDGDNRLADLAVIAPGGFASDWTQITGLSGDRILYYSASRGRGCIGTIDGDNRLADLAVIAPGGFASDWTQITGLSGDRILYYSAGSGRGCIGTIDGDNRLADLAVIAPGGFASDWTQITGL